jgi:putative spermidine/putrescine transport system ATP-binding protein
MTEVGLLFNEVEFQRGDFHLEVNASFPQKELTVVLGPSGSGKTTLLDLAAGFIAPDRGRIIELGIDVTHMPPESRRVGVVFQEHALFPHMNVLDNVAFGPSVRGSERGVAREKASIYLDLVKMGHFSSRRPDTLSGGERQRVALARALAIEPQLLLLDEPFSALDAALRRELRREVKRIQEKTGITALLVTHDQDEAMALADHLAVMRNGRIEQSGPPREIWRNPNNLFTGLFLGRSTRLGILKFSRNPSGALYAITRAGEIPLPAGSQTPDLPATVMVRPDGAKLDPRGTISGTITDVEYSEGLWRLRLEPQDGLGGDLMEIDYDGSEEPPKGEVVSITVRADSARVLKGSAPKMT